MGLCGQSGPVIGPLRRLPDVRAQPADGPGAERSGQSRVRPAGDRRCIREAAVVEPVHPLGGRDSTSSTPAKVCGVRSVRFCTGRWCFGEGIVKLAADSADRWLDTRLVEAFAEPDRGVRGRRSVWWTTPFESTPFLGMEYPDIPGPRFNPDSEPEMDPATVTRPHHPLGGIFIPLSAHTVASTDPLCQRETSPNNLGTCLGMSGISQYHR